MNRCRFFQSALLAGLLALSTAAGAQQALQSLRTFNANVQRGTLEIVNPPQVRLNGKAATLSPGARLFNEHNRIVMPTHYVGKKVVVNYLTDQMGQVADTWILTPSEIASVAPSEQSRLKAAAEGVSFKNDSEAFQPGRPYHEQPQFPNKY